MADEKGTPFGGRVLQARLAAAAKRGRPLPQSEVAKAMGVTSVTVSRWETGDKEPALDTIARLASVLGCDAGWLAFGDPDALPPADPKADAEAFRRLQERGRAIEASERASSQRVAGARPNPPTRPGKGKR